MIQLGAGIHGGMVITPDFRRSGSNAVQVTYFTRDGQASGHTQFKSLADALDENFLDVDHPVSRMRKNTDPAKVFSAYEEAIFEPHNDEILHTPFHYLSPLRPLSGVAVEGFVSSDLAGRMGVLSRYEPLDLDTQTRLDMFPMSPEAIRAAAEELAVMLAPKLKSRYARKLAENPLIKFFKVAGPGMKGVLNENLELRTWEVDSRGEPLHKAVLNRSDLATVVIDKWGSVGIEVSKKADVDEVVPAIVKNIYVNNPDAMVEVIQRNPVLGNYKEEFSLPDIKKYFGVNIDVVKSNPPRRRARNSSSWDFVRVLERQADLWKPFARQNNLPMPITKNVVGCGFYGCIFETTVPGVGLKITRAYDEASFFAWQQSAQTVGIVPVHAVAGLPGLTEYYLIWRDLLDDCCEGAVNKLWLRMIDKGHLNPDFGKVLLKQRMDTSLEEQMANGIELVEHYEGMNDIGHALINAAESGYVIFDLHPNNLGRWLDYDQLIIFDAGFKVKNEIYPVIYYLVKGEDGVELITYREWDERDRMASKI